MLDCTCKHCGANFKAEPSHVKRGRGHYCSYLCASLAHTKAVPVKDPAIEQEIREYMKPFPPTFVSEEDATRYLRTAEKITGEAQAAWDDWRSDPFLRLSPDVSDKWDTIRMLRVVAEYGSDNLPAPYAKQLALAVGQ